MARDGTINAMTFLGSNTTKVWARNGINEIQCLLNTDTHKLHSHSSSMTGTSTANFFAASDRFRIMKILRQLIENSGEVSESSFENSQLAGRFSSADSTGGGWPSGAVQTPGSSGTSRNGAHD